MDIDPEIDDMVDESLEDDYDSEMLDRDTMDDDNDMEEQRYRDDARMDREERRYQSRERARDRALELKKARMKAKVDKIDAKTRRSEVKGKKKVMLKLIASIGMFGLALKWMEDHHTDKVDKLDIKAMLEQAKNSKLSKAIASSPSTVKRALTTILHSNRSKIAKIYQEGMRVIGTQLGGML